MSAPPYYTTTHTSPPYPVNNPPYPPNNGPAYTPYPPNHIISPPYNNGPMNSYPPPPLNSVPQATTYYYASPAAPPHIAAINSQPRPYWSRPFHYGTSAERRRAFIIFAIVAVSMFAIFLAVFITLAVKSNNDFNNRVAEADRRHAEFRNKNFPEGW